MDDTPQPKLKSAPRRSTPASRRAAAADHSRTHRQKLRESGMPDGRTIDGEILSILIGAAMSHSDPERREAYRGHLSRKVAEAIATSEEALPSLVAAVRRRIDYRCKQIEAQAATNAKQGQPRATGDT